jgi:hypothetical protein
VTFHELIAWLTVSYIAAGASLASAQVSSGALDQLDQAIGQRVETALILGTANSISTGGYKWQLDNADGTITRATWEFDLGNKHPIGDTGLHYVWNYDGGVGYANYHDQFTDGVLAGNDERFQSYALGSNIGPRIYFTNDISVLGEAGLIYGYTINQFQGLTNVGNSLVVDSLVNWHVQTLSVTPSIQLQYERTFFGSLKVLARSNFAYYTTFPIEQSTGFYSFRSNSEVWQNSLDLDYRTGLRLFNCEAHVGGTVTRTDLYDGIREGLDVNHYWSAAGRVTFDTDKKLWILSELGIGGSYTWGDGFHGDAIGIIFGISF